MAQSVEPQIADLANGWLKHYKLKYFIEVNSIRIMTEVIPLSDMRVKKR